MCKAQKIHRRGKFWVSKREFCDRIKTDMDFSSLIYRLGLRNMKEL